MNSGYGDRPALRNDRGRGVARRFTSQDQRQGQKSAKSEREKTSIHHILIMVGWRFIWKMI